MSQKKCLLLSLPMPGVVVGPCCSSPFGHIFSVSLLCYGGKVEEKKNDILPENLINKRSNICIFYYFIRYFAFYM